MKGLFIGLMLAAGVACAGVSNLHSTGTVVQVTTDTNIIVVTDAGGTNAPSNPQAWGGYDQSKGATNQNGWFMDFSMKELAPPIGLFGLYSGEFVPSNWSGNGDSCTGTVHVAYLPVTNIVAVSYGTLLSIRGGTVSNP